MDKNKNLLKGGKIGHKGGGGRPKLKSVKTVQEFKAAHISELPKIWKEFDVMLADLKISHADKIKILSFKFEQLAGKAPQTLDIPQISRFIVERPSESKS